MHRTVFLASLLLSLSLASALRAAEDADIFVSDFESETYGQWKTTGAAFGPGPAKGTLPNQMHVTGYLGERLVNSFFKGDDSIGTLTSPPFKIERPHINFLIGGGQHPGEACINLIIDGKVVRTATGPNDRAGGSEELDWASWDVGEFKGREATIQIVDNRKGGWGHINIDHIVQSAKPRQAAPAERTLTVTDAYLHLPVRNGAPMRRVSLTVDGKVVRRFEIELAEDKHDFWVFSDVSPFKGKSLSIHAGKLPAESKALANIRLAAMLPDADTMYREKQRPQFHFTSRRGWLNDPNGLVHQDGVWHLYYQHNPFGWRWGNMHWGHAVSKDLFHWEEIGDAIHPWTDIKGAAFSGSAVIDKQNTAGWKNGQRDVLVAALTDTDAGESIAYSNDGGRTFTMFEGNPVVKHQGRDPKLVWHEPTKNWVMAVYTEAQGKQWIAFHTSPNLKTWTFQSRIEGYYECPDLFELKIAGESTSRWVLYAADGKYALGTFDGKTFKPDHAGKHQMWHGNFYAAQTYDNAPDHRRVQIGWGQGIEFPGMPFNQQIVVPVDLTLRNTGEGIRMFAEPVKELAQLRTKTHEMKNLTIKPGDANPLAGIEAELIEIDATFNVGDKGVVGFVARGAHVRYDAGKQIVEVAGIKSALKPVDGKVRLHALIDRGSVECFANDGRVAFSKGHRPAENDRRISMIVDDVPATVHSLTVYELKSVWR